ncbi:hypothetical protein ABZT08_09205 [Streptomyces sp. NPDC005526]|uniref:hypothetical protein n=1 Tax=Streptomyces sp. NPDC005526 TaxID=3156885 RepID=UPI0033B7DAA0
MNHEVRSRVGSLRHRGPAASGLVLILSLAMTGSVPATSAASGPRPPGWARLCDSSLNGPAAEALVRLTERRHVQEYPGMHASLAKAAASVRGWDEDGFGFCTLHTRKRLAPAELEMAADIWVGTTSYPVTKRPGEEGYLYFGLGETTETFAVAGAGPGRFGRHAWLDFHCQGMGRDSVRMALTVHSTFRGDARQQAVDMVTVIHSVALKFSEELRCGPEDELPATPPTEPTEESAP